MSITAVVLSVIAFGILLFVVEMSRVYIKEVGKSTNDFWLFIVLLAILLSLTMALTMMCIRWRYMPGV